MLKQAKLGSSDNRINYSGELHYLISSTTWELCTRAGNESLRSLKFPNHREGASMAYSWLKAVTNGFTFRTCIDN